MKKLLFLALSAFLLCATPAFAQDETPVPVPVEQTVTNQTVEIGKERAWWRKIVRGTARAVTLGAVQAASDSIKANASFHFAFDHDGIDTDSYSVKINTAVYTTVPVSQLVNGTVMVPFLQGLPKGTYQFQVVATGQGGTGVSDLFSLSVTAGNPSNPRNPRIIK